MTRIKIYQVDAFTKTPFTGNAAGVVPDADNLSDAQMQMIARELNNSETAFILKPDADDHDVRIRYFTPSMEVPTCGHATIAAHYVRAVRQDLAPWRVWTRIGIGRLPVDIERDRDDIRIIMTQGPPEFGEPAPGDLRTQFIEALGIEERDIASQYPIVKVDTGASKIIVGLNSRNTLNAISPNMDALLALAEPLDTRGYFVFTRDGADDDIDGFCRMFAPQIGILEDPVTGNGNGPLGAYFVKYALKGSAKSPAHFRFRQGEAMRRPGTVDVWVDHADGEPTCVRAGGRAVIAFSASLEI